MLKRTLSIILAVAMLCTLVPAYVLAEEVEEAAVVENEEVIVADEELEVVPMADPFDTSLLVDEDGVQQPAGITIPDTFAGHGVDAFTDTNSKINALTAANVPEGLTYVLVDSDVEGKSNFTSDFEGDWISGSDNQHPWIEGANTRRANSATELSTHEARIYVPAGEDRTFQVVTMVARKYTETEAGRYAKNSLPTGQGALVWIDDEPVAVNAETGHDVFGSIQSPAIWANAGLVNWTASDDNLFYVWEWGPEVTLEADAWHTIEFMPASGADGARIPGIILTEDVGYDWTQIVPFPKKTYKFSQQYSKIIKRITNTLAAAGYIDFEGPVFKGEVVADADKITATTLVFRVPEAEDEGKYAFAPVSYKAYVNGVEAEIVNGTVTAEGLVPAAECEVTVAAFDMLGNVTKLVTTLKTAGAEHLNYAFFAPDDAIENVTALSDIKDSIKITWPAATAGTKEVAEPKVSYNVYVDGEFEANVEANEYTIADLATDTEYELKVVTCTDNDEATEEDINSSLTAKFSTAKETTISVIDEKTTATSAVLEATKYLDDSTLEIKEIIVNGAVVNNATISGNEVTINGLVSGVANTIKVTLTEISGDASVDHNYDVVTVKALVNDNFTLTEDDCIAVDSDLPMPLTYKTADEWNQLLANNNDSSKLFDSTKVATADDKGVVAKHKINVKEAGNYYAVADIYTYSTSRSMSATIGDKAVGHNFAATDTSIHIEVAPAPIELAAGNHEVVLNANGGWVRLGMFALVPESVAYDAEGKLLNPAGVYESVKAFVDATFTTEKAVMDFYIKDSRILNESSLQEVRLMTEDCAIVSWKPTTFALGADITYTVSLDGKKVGTVASNQASQFVLEGLSAGKHTVAVKADADDEAQEISFSIGGVVPEVAVEEAEGTYTVKVDLQNMTGTDRNIAVFAATFVNGKMTMEKFDVAEGLTYGKPESVEFTFTPEKATTLVDFAANLDADTRMTKIFVVDADTCVPFAY